MQYCWFLSKTHQLCLCWRLSNMVSEQHLLVAWQRRPPFVAFPPGLIDSDGQWIWLTGSLKGLHCSELGSGCGTAFQLIVPILSPQLFSVLPDGSLSYCCKLSHTTASVSPSLSVALCHVLQSLSPPVLPLSLCSGYIPQIKVNGLFLPYMVLLKCHAIESTANSNLLTTELQYRLL